MMATLQNSLDKDYEIMTNAQMYEFDINGFVILKNVLDHSFTSALKRWTASRVPARGSGKFSCLDIDPIFLEVMALPQILSVMRVLIGDYLRFDHAFGISMTKEVPIIENLHAGPLEEQGSFWYQCVQGQRIHNGLMKALIPLNDVKRGDGGFVCVPGSHKANIIHRIAPDSHLIVNPPLSCGDVLIFTEALVHGSKQWRSEERRTVLVYSYAPGFMAWKDYEMVRPFLEMATNDIQRYLLRPPYVGNYDERHAQNTGEWPKDRREKIEFH